MKKLMTIAAVAAGVTASLWAVESATVGYTNSQLDTDAGEYMHNIGIAYSNVGDSGASYVVDTKVFSNVAVEGDTIYAFSPDYWDLDGYVCNGYDGTTSEPLGWMYAGADGSISTVASISFEKGDNLFYQPADAISAIAVAGQVAPSGEQTLEFNIDNGDWMFPIANPFPIDTTIGDLETFANAGDTIYVFDPMSWDLSAYVYNGTPAEGWMFAGADGSIDTVTDTDYVVLPAGQGGFIQPTATCTWSVTVNY